MKRNTIRLTESQLHRVIKESVRQVLKEGDYSSPRTEADIAFDRFIRKNLTQIDPTKCSKVGVDYKLLQKYHWCAHHCYGGNGRIINDYMPLKEKLRQQFIANYYRRKREMDNQYDDDFEY